MDDFRFPNNADGERYSLSPVGTGFRIIANARSGSGTIFRFASCQQPVIDDQYPFDCEFGMFRAARERRASIDYYFLSTTQVSIHTELNVAFAAELNV